LKKENPTRINEKSGGKILKAFQDPQSWQPFCNPRRVTAGSHPKNAFWPNIFVGALFQIPIRPRRTCGLRPPKGIGPDGKSRLAGKLGPAAILNQNPIFEMASNKKATRFYLQLQ
jgi:hypothetical protein